MITVPGYRILRRLYEGNRTIVYQGWRIDDKKPVAIKTIQPDHITPENIETLRQEHEITKHLDVEGVIRSCGLENSDSGPALILEDFSGLPLENLITPRGLPLDFFLDAAIRTVDILSELHQRRIIHKNISPSTIIIDPDTRQVKMTDLGAPSLHEREGNLSYMSPEQTGRMNRAVDFRTDFYSLGVTLYHMLTGRLPFQSTDALELVHSHIAREPENPCQLNPDVPAAVSDIVMKLLSKNAEDRYQSGYGLIADLQSCVDQLKREGRIERFDLGMRDVPHTFTLRQKLYGREREVQSLLATFLRVRQGTAELLLVSGPPGIGKTALINEINKPVIGQRGYFITGKYDQLKKNVPYSAVILAFKNLIRQLLGENEEKVRLWKERLTQALGTNGQIIIDVIPEVELIIGKQPPVSPAGPTEALNRFNRVIQNFVGVFADREHPLVLFLDDLQWIDLASLNLIRTLIIDHRIEHFLIIGAYRDNEIKAHHPLLLLLDQVAKEGMAVTNIHLPSLSIEHVNHLIQEALRCAPGQSESLARIVHTKTGGNPFFVNQMLNVFCEEKVLRYEVKHGWRWNVEEIDRLNVTDNVIDLLVGKIGKLSLATQDVLKLASCIGNRFDLETLTVVYEQSPERAVADLDQALQEGLVIPSNDNYLFFHDRIQEAAYSLIPAEEKKKIHYKIGKLVLGQTKPETLPAKAFYIADQLNAGADLITGQPEKYDLAELNLMAGKKAKASTAYASAVKYLTKGIELLAEDSWLRHYSLTHDLFMECSECQYLSGNFEEAEGLFAVIIRNAKTNREKAEVYNIKVVLSQNRGRSGEALENGREGLRLLGMHMPRTPSRLILYLEILKIKWFLGRRTVDDLLLLPKMTDPARQTITDILINMAPAAYYHNKRLLTLDMLKIFTVSLRYGQTDAAPMGFATYGFILCSVFGEYQSGYQYANTAVYLSNQGSDLSLKSQCNFLLAGFVNHWTKHLRTGIETIVNGYVYGLESGNFLYGGYCAGVHTITMLFKGDRLDEVHEQGEKYLEVLRHIHNEDMLLAITAICRMTLCLRGKTTGLTALGDDRFNEAAFAETLKPLDKKFILCIYYILKVPLYYLFDELPGALQLSQELQKNTDHLLGMFYLVHHNFYYSLTLTALHSGASTGEKGSHWKQLKQNQKMMKIWADNCPGNCLHKYVLVQAEMARISGKYQEAEDLYERAIQLARENEFVQEEAIGNELAAQFHFSRGRKQIARSYLMEALSCYGKWGATAKVRQLEEKYASLIESTRKLESDSAFHWTANAVQLLETGSPALDLSTVLKASQAISGEISLDRLLRELMKIVIENAGARSGFLILEREGKLYLEATGTADHGSFSTLQSEPLEGCNALAESVVHYTARTQETVILNNAVHEGMFTHDPYIINHASKSILCTPIINKRRLKGILYLENDLTSHAFTPERVEILDALASQIAISLENARLYEEARHARESLEESEQKFRTLAETMRAGIVIYRENEFLYVNPAVEAITGYSREEMLAMNFSSIIHPDYLNVVLQRAAERLAGMPAPTQYEFKIIRKDGQERWLMSTAGRIEYGRERAMITTLFDISNEKKAEQEQLRLYEENVRQYRERIDEEQRHQQEKENILMDIHDGIGGITTNIGLLSEVALKMSAPDEINKSLATISNLAREGTAEIRSLMFSLDSKDHSWRTLVGELKSYGAKTFKPHGIAFEMTTEIQDSSPEPGGLLFLHLFRIYREALTNIIKHAKATRVSVNLRVAQKRLFLVVRDNGQGCDEAALVGKGRGVNNMRVRAAQIGGSIMIAVDGGMSVSLDIPLPR
jgi:PAS domain S-box-containing protein